MEDICNKSTNHCQEIAMYFLFIWYADQLLCTLKITYANRYLQQPCRAAWFLVDSIFNYSINSLASFIFCLFAKLWLPQVGYAFHFLRKNYFDRKPITVKILYSNVPDIFLHPRYLLRNYLRDFPMFMHL